MINSDNNYHWKYSNLEIHTINCHSFASLVSFPCSSFVLSMQDSPEAV